MLGQEWGAGEGGVIEQTEVNRIEKQSVFPMICTCTHQPSTVLTLRESLAAEDARPSGLSQGGIEAKPEAGPFPVHQGAVPGTQFSFRLLF